MRAKFYIGQIVCHRRFGYRGVVADVDPEFKGSETWYDSVARTRPPRDQPWYRVMVDGAEQETYVAERHLEPDMQAQPVSNPSVQQYFSTYENGRYRVLTH